MPASMPFRWSAISHLSLSWRDAVDVLIVAVVIYNLMLLIRGTRAVQMILGLGAILAVYGFSAVLQLPTLRGVLHEILFYLPLAIIVLFASDIRRALAQFGRNPFLRLFGAGRSGPPFAEVAAAIDLLSARKIGALIAIERTVGLKTYAESGVPLDAALSTELLINVFEPGTPLHDGAVVISNHRIVSASCYLPLSQRAGLPSGYGTRHRAALGLSEETDAVVLVVSEERGTVAVAIEGDLRDGIGSEDLRRVLAETSAGGSSRSPA
jgi:diadenylate cyclase